MRMIPPFVGKETKSSAEKRLFKILQNTNLEGNPVCLHSLNLPEHIYKTTGELDFVIICSRGVFILEVKGGGISCKEGIWKFEDRWGEKHHSSEGPFNQASSGMYSLRKRMNRSLNFEGLEDTVFGYGVVFPDCDFNTRGMEWDQELVLDDMRLRTEGMQKYLDNLANYWHQKHPDSPATIPDSSIGQLLQALRPDFEMVRSLNVEAEALEARLVSMTLEQYSRLDIIDHCPRILIEGGAGTGKTFIASALAERYSAEGKKVLFLCFSPLLAGYLNKQIQESGVTVSSVSQLMLDHTIKHGGIPSGYFPGMPITDPWYENNLLPAFTNATESLTDTDKYDILIIDEAQDILNMEYMVSLNSFLRGGFENGTWRIFLDPCNQGPIFGFAEPEAIELLRSYGPVPPKLKVNCRNTNEIVTQTKLITGSDMSNSSTGPGPDVEIEYYSDMQDAARLIEEYMIQLEDQGCSHSEITILSPFPIKDSCVNKLEKKRKSQIFTLRGTTDETFPHSKITFATIPNFKGLENRYILLVDMNDLDTTPEIRANLYVGMTRARVKLWICFHENLKDKIKETIRRNIKNLSKEIEND